MKNINKILKAAIVIGIALAFLMPGAVAFTNTNPQFIPRTDIDKKTPLGMNPGWIEQASGFWEASRGVNYVHAVDENIVWAVGYDGSGGSLPVQEFTKTINGGDLWEADTISSAPVDGDSAMIFALDDMTAWVPIHSGNPQGIWKTSDGGDTWVRQDTALYSGSGAFPNVVHFWDENVGWCQGDPVDGYFEMYTTNDGGDTWVRVPEENIPEPSGPGEYGTVGYYDVVGDTVWWGTQWASGPGRVFKSTDRGLNWEVYDTPFPSAGWVDVRMKDANNGLAMDKRAAASYLAETSDGGETWTLVTPTGAFYGYDISYVPGTDNTWISTGAAAGASGASYSLDGGHTWVDYPEVNGIQLLDCDFIEGGIGWAGAFNQDEFTGGMYKYEPGAEEPDLEFEFEGGKGLTVTIKNVGFGDATNVDWSINIEGGLIIIPREDSGSIATLESGGSEEVTMSVIGIGLGIITDIPAFTAFAECDEGDSQETTKTGKVFLTRVTL
jgi:photosystem II stability/assembly factor-like uncharacterized protein